MTVAVRYTRPVASFVRTFVSLRAKRIAASMICRSDAVESHDADVTEDACHEEAQALSSESTSPLQKTSLQEGCRNLVELLLDRCIQDPPYGPNDIIDLFDRVTTGYGDCDLRLRQDPGQGQLRR